VGFLEILVLVTASTISLLIGFIVLLKNSKNMTNILFSFLSLTLFAWSVANYFSLHSASDAQSLNIIKTVFILIVIQNTLLHLFLDTYTNRVPVKELKKYVLYIVLSFFLMILIYANIIVVDFKNENIVVGPLIALFILHALYSVIKGFIAFGKMKFETITQKKFLFYGLLILWVIVPLTNFVFPSFLDITIFVRFSSLYVLVFNSLIAYSILKYKLFDIRAAVARATAYLLVTFFMLIVYTTTFNVIQAAAIPDLVITNQQLIINITLTVAMVVSYPYIKRYFDRITSKIFFKDAYDSQELLDDLNRTLVNSTEIQELLTKSSLLIQENLKTSFTTFFIRATSYFPDRIIGALRDDPSDKDAEKIQELASKLRRKVMYAETEPKNDLEKELVKLLKKNDIDIMARLVSTVEYDVKGIGYIFMGAKKSGSLYTKQDLKILEIMSNELTIAVENVLRFEEIEQFNVTLQKKIDDATKKLKQNNDKLKALDEAKDEFVSMASHQLRTPLTSVKGYISMVLEGDAGKVSKPQQKMLGQALFSSQRMVYLISDLLNVSRLRTGKFVIEPKPVYLPDVVESEILQLREGAEAKNLTLSFDKPKKFAILNLDEMKLRQVIMNFTDNAIYYTKSGGKITVSLKETPKTVELRIKDTGIGVPKKEMHKLFTKFYRAENARKARPDGTGLGLFMVKKVIIAQGGSVIFDSKEGKGSTFGFIFPKNKLLVQEPDVLKKTDS